MRIFSRHRVARPGVAPVAGISLLEVMAAVFVVSVAGGAILTLWPAATIISTTEQERARAHQIVCEELERNVKLPEFPRITSGRQRLVWDNGTPDDLSDDTQGEIEIIVRDPKTNQRIASAPINPTNQLWYRVEVTMSWHPRGSRSGKTLRETVMTYKVP